MVVKLKGKIAKTGHVKNIFSEDEEMQDIMIDFCLIKRNLIFLLEIKPWIFCNFQKLT